jgi:VWFA-related protein
MLLNIRVLDQADRAIAELKAEQFTVLDGQVPQVVSCFSNRDEPMSLVVVLDATMGMAARLDETRRALANLARTSNPQDELGLVVIHDDAQIVVHLGRSAGEIEHATDSLQANGFGAMWDGMYLGVKELQNSRCRRKVIVVFSDDGDTYSRHTSSELMSLLKHGDVKVYVIGVFDRYANRFQTRMRALRVEEVTSVTGGRVLSGNDISRAVAQLRYVLPTGNACFVRVFGRSTGR